MAKLTYLTICSLDGFVEDADGNFGWAEPSEEVHAFVNELARPIGTHLLGRRMYETMAYWETGPTGEEVPAVYREFAELWRDSDKVVYSRTLAKASTARTRLEAEFDPAAVARMKRDADRDLGVGGAELAAQALAAGLLDELHLFLVPVLVGTGKPALPVDVRNDLELLDQRRFANGMVYLGYGVGAESGA